MSELFKRRRGGRRKWLRRWRRNSTRFFLSARYWKDDEDVVVALLQHTCCAFVPLYVSSNRSYYIVPSLIDSVVHSWREMGDFPPSSRNVSHWLYSLASFMMKIYVSILSREKSRAETSYTCLYKTSRGRWISEEPHFPLLYSKWGWKKF